jgi:hypothetical protein
LIRIVFPYLNSQDTFAIQAYNAGRTPALLAEGHCAFKKHPVQFTNPSEDYQDPFFLPMQNLIISNDGFEVRRIVPEAELSQDDKDGVGMDPQCLFVYGRILYWDVFTDRSAPDAEPYVTRWIFRYDSTKKGFVRVSGDYTKNN